MNFLKTAFKITLFQFFLIAFFAAIKSLILFYNLPESYERGFVWLCFGIGIFFVLALSVNSYIENQEGGYEQWRTKPKNTILERVQLWLVTWGLTIPIALFYILNLYVFAPTSWSMAIALYAGIVLRNIISFFSKKKLDHENTSADT